MSLFILVLLLCLSACELHFGAIPTPTLTPTTAPTTILTVVWVQDGDLYAWREDNPTPLKIAATGIIQPYLAPDGRHVAFIRGQQGDKSSLWAVGIDGVGEQQLVKPEVLKSLRNGHPQINQVKWLDGQTIYFNTTQRSMSWYYDHDDNLYRAELGGSDPQLILPPGAGGNFAISSDGQHIAVIRAGIYDTQKGQVALLDPFALHVDEKLTFTSSTTPDVLAFYPPLQWNRDSTFMRVAIPDRDSKRQALWRIPVDGDSKIFGYMDNALVDWSDDQMLTFNIVDTAGLIDELGIADTDGQNLQIYATGNISLSRWLPDGKTFVYQADDALWIGQRGSSPRKLIDASVVNLIAAGNNVVIYATATELRYVLVDTEASTLLATFESSPAFEFDAVVAPLVVAP